MESTISERLTQIIDYLKISDVEFARKLDVTKQEVNRWKNGVKIPLIIIGKIFELWPEINGNWFITGTGLMINEFEESGKIVKKKICTNPICEAEKTELREKIDELQRKIIFLQQEKIDWLGAKKI